MNHKLWGHQVGFAAGSTAAIIHTVWTLTVGTMPEVAQKFANFHMAIHFMNVPVTVQGFSWGGAIALVLFVFCVWYIVGRIFAAVYNSIAR